MKERLARFLYGRNGNDQLNYFIMVVTLVLIILASIIGGTVGTVIYVLVLALLGLTYFRMFSKNTYRRSEENGKYIRLRYNVLAWLRLHYERWIQRKDYKFFTCPGCKASLRVPKGKGKIKIVCRQCGNTFTGKT